MTQPLPWHHPRRWGCAALVWALMAQMVVPAHAYVSQLPGAYTAPPDTNVMFTLDDSGSMQADVIPDVLDVAGLPGNSQTPPMWTTTSGFLDIAYFTNSNATQQNTAGRYLRSADGNPLYYNPKVRYRPWPDPSDDKKLLPEATPTAVRIHPSDPTQQFNVIDLTRQLGATPFWPGTYFVKTSTAALPLGMPTSAESAAATFQMVEIRSDVATYPKRFVAPEFDLRSDCASATECTYAEELQNFANWLQYYRSRSLMAKGGVSAAFARQSTNLRVGFGTINRPVQLGVRSFTGSARSNFYTQVFAATASSITPLRTASVAVGDYFASAGAGNPWAEDPAASSVGTEYTCRRAFHILTTDGYWNERFTTTVGNADNLTGQFTPPKPDGSSLPFTDTGTGTTSWSVSPYADEVSNTLSDVAALYWKTDLRPDLANNVIPSSRDPAYWQHVTMYTVGFGIGGTGGVTKRSDGSVADLTSQAARDQLIVDRAALNWTTPTTLSPTTGDDLIHASMSGHGRYMNSTNPTDLANNLASALAEAVDNPGDLATLAFDSAQVLSGGRLYQAIFSPARWYGRLYAFTQDPATGIVNNRPIDSVNTSNTSQVWEASNKMPAPELRNIFTSQGGVGSGTLFSWDNLSTAQKADLGDDKTLLTYLRGDASREVANGGGFRDRSRYTVNGVKGGVLGDVVGGSPLKGPDAGGGYDRLPTTTTSGQASYATFRSASGPLADMLNTMFLGANDGMLHAFSLSNGVERFAYVPSTVYNVPRSTAGGLPEQKLRLLASPDYTHRFTVDGPPNVADAYFGGEWHSVLVGSTGAGARGIFAMDVTRPAVATGAFDTSKILWEFSEADSPDMGFVLAYPHLVRMRNDRWAVISGNGVDSASGKAVLYIRDAETGASIQQFTVGPTGENGLSQPNFILNSSREVIAIYAGDLKGNLWKFDVSGTDASTWAPVFGSSTPFFSAVGPGGNAQPITVMPEISAHPNGGAMVIFGTGKLFEPSDTANDSTNVNLAGQSLYGIWDKPGETTGVVIDSTTRTTLLKLQAVEPVTTSDPARFRRTTTGGPNWATQRGWVLDLASGGERSNLPAQQFRNVVFMATNTPSVADPCANSGTSKIFALDPVTGSAPSFAVFDTNDNRLFDPADKGLNVLLNGSALLTQPVFQVFSSGTGGIQTGPTVQPIGALDRGQATSARSGGVELSRASGTKTNPTAGGGTGEPDCKGLMSAAQSNTDLLQQLINGCASKTRISWRQLK